jgi:hypothetical protein
VNITVNRVGGASGAATVSYMTKAVAGSDFIATSGSASWNDGDSTPKIVSVPITVSDSGNKSFSFVLTNTVGASLGATATATVTITSVVGPNPNLAIHVSGNHLVDASGATVQLRGANVAGLDSVSVMGWSPGNPWGGDTGTPTPDWNLIKSWGINAVRIPLNEASWLGLTCTDMGGYGKTVINGQQVQNAVGTTVRADPGGNYQTTVLTSVDGATAAGLYVIVDLHLSAPGNACPTAQNAMADADHAIAYWTSLATTLKIYPNVIFELFNEPFLDQAPLQNPSNNANNDWLALLNGSGSLTSFWVAGTPNSVAQTWHTVGMQAMLNAVRATGATNVILTSTLAYSSMMGGWLQYHPTDTLSPSQIGAVWHAYPGGSSYPAQVNCIGLPSCSAQTMNDVKGILAAGYPVVITEFGDPVGGSSAPFSQMLLPFSDANGISYLAWTWDVWPGTQFYLITNGAGAPTAGFGVYVKAHLLCRAAGTANCP